MDLLCCFFHGFNQSVHEFTLLGLPVFDEGGLPSGEIPGGVPEAL